ncbi:MAG: hypothetical protein MJ198_01285 [Bacteroidales bacterium]|nr:hypothetical protein [Bacteroidales bacterium]
MKKLVLLAATATIALFSCKKNNDVAQVKNVVLSHINITEAAYLAVGENAKQNLLKSETTEEQDTMPKLFVIDLDGTMQSIQFQYNAPGISNESREFLNKNLQVLPISFISVGNEYIWMRNCKYVLTDEENYPEELESFVSSLKYSTNEYQYLIRKKDGSVIDMNQLKEDFLSIDPYNDYQVPSGKLYPIENGFYISVADPNPRVVKVTDNGTNVAEITTVAQANLNNFVVNKNGIVAGMCYQEDTSYDGYTMKPLVFFPNGTSETIYTYKNWESGKNNVIVSIAGKWFFISAIKNYADKSEISIFRISVEDQTVAIDSVRTQIVPFVYSSISNSMPRYSESSVVSYIENGYLVTFDAETEQFSSIEVPEFKTKDCFQGLNGNMYAYENNLLEKIYVYDVTKKEVSTINTDKSSIVATWGYAPTPEFNASKNAFIQYGQNVNGNFMTVVTDCITGKALCSESLETEGIKVSLLYKLF